MLYLVEVVQRNRIVKVVKRTPEYDSALSAFDKAKVLLCREVRFFKYDGNKDRVLLKYVDRTARRLASSAYRP